MTSFEVTEEMQTAEVPFAAEDAARNRRWLILGLLFFVTVINFVDRQTLSILAPVLRKVFHLSNQAYGRILSSFQFGMMVGEFPMGALMDRWGARIGLSLAVLWWSGATGAQALARSGTQFGATMFWMGTGECGNYSGGLKTIARLFTKRNRTLALGIFNSGSMIGATIATPLVVYLLTHYSFRAAFLVPAVLGLLWIPVWWLLRGPEDIRRELQVRQPTRELWMSSSAWAVMTLRFFHGPVLQFYWYWIPLYLANVRHLSMTQVGLLAWIPYALGDSGGVLGGWAAGALRRGGLSMLNVRRWTLFGSGAACLVSLLVPFARQAVLALLVMGFAIMAANVFSANMYGAITDLVPEAQAGRVTGMTGIAGGLSGLLFPLLTGWLVDHVSYTPAFALVSIMPLIGAAMLFTIGRRYYTAPELALPLEASPPSDPGYVPAQIAERWRAGAGDVDENQ
jgi:MFS transporter, ACS family, hexuronate transporter